MRESGRSPAKRAIRLLQVFSAMCCGALLLAPGAAAPGAKVDLVCLFEVELTFSPPLNFNTTEAVLRGLASSCTTPSGRYPRIKSGVVFSSMPLRASGCSPAPLTITGSGGTIVWNDGTASTYDVTISTDPRTGRLGIEVDFTDGTFGGGSLTGVPVILAQHGLCGLGGVRSLTFGLGVAVITVPASRQRSRATIDRRRAHGRHG